jgi:hypothetical protein
MELRKNTEIPILEQSPLDQLLGAKFPVKRDVLRHFFHHHKTLNKSIDVAKNDAVVATEKFWIEAGVQPKERRRSIADLSSLHNSYKVVVHGQPS